ncbi:hypothetical protein LEP1GSC072_4078 [Leptospira noguchii str. Bonito]|nr:hypothetical protein LEP1GSC072_4078 [Leptospira noguchii str. Bonito]
MTNNSGLGAIVENFYIFIKSTVNLYHFYTSEFLKVRIQEYSKIQFFCKITFL